jgi:hypothetical protein
LGTSRVKDKRQVTNDHSVGSERRFGSGATETYDPAYANVGFEDARKFLRLAEMGAQPKVRFHEEFRGP